ncbi:hypothetical protein AWB91_09000 [Mycobacterium paraense]|uniref:Uncharacterized protein n=2 Tax=Mycobacterium paraense TaxID=767916 RepID=A0ABX3VSV9_9MYCO|nr:hypothetical protein AWB91_09000 [Mycobacterium paraense]ORW34686.1 hypothetical protein AWB88_02780 [Mycobacterium paraense]
MLGNAKATAVTTRRPAKLIVADISVALAELFTQVDSQFDAERFYDEAGVRTRDLHSAAKLA